MLEFKPDAEMAMARHEAWWHGEIIDRPPVWITAPKSADHPPFPEKRHSSIRERWFDTEYLLDVTDAYMARTAYLGDSLPTWWPNLGPEVYSAFLGCPLEYTNETSWAVPIVKDWSDLDLIRFDEANEYWLKIGEMTDAGLVIPGRTESTSVLTSSGQLSTNSGSSGRGPTRLISPTSTFQKLGNSFIFVSRSQAPNGVTRSSFFTVNRKPLFF